MAQDFSDLATTEAYAALLTRIGDRDVALALAFDPAYTTPTNVKTRTVRWNSANVYWEYYNGSAWAALASTYNITVAKANHLVGGVAGALAYQSGIDASAFSAAGTAGQIALSGGTGAPTWSDLGLITYGYTSKATPVDADSLPLSDSAVSNGPKKLTVANLKAALFTGWGALIAAGTSKTTPVDADSLALADSAASSATKKLTWASLKATLKTATDALYMALVAPGAAGEVLTSNGSAWASAPAPVSFITGMGMDWFLATAPAGWIFAAGTIGDASSGATNRANADCEALFLALWADYSNTLLAVSGGRGVSAAADWAAHKTIAVPDLRGRATVGRDTMISAANRLTTAGSGVDGATLGAFGGAQNHTLTTAELASHSHAAGSLAATLSGSYAGGGGTYGVDTAATGSYSTSGTLAVTGSTGSAGSGSAHNNVQPSFVCNKIIKL